MDKRVVIILAIVILIIVLKSTITKAAVAVAPSSKIGTSGKSYLGREDMSRGMRNNNPGNLRITASAWIGKVPKSENTDGAFEQFYAYAYGVRAMIRLIQNYIRDGHNTIERIIRRYAPPVENHTDKYIAYVERTAGIDRNKTIDRNSRSSVGAIVKAMAYMENGVDAITEEDIQEAWKLL